MMLFVNNIAVFFYNVINLFKSIGNSDGYYT